MKGRNSWTVVVAIAALATAAPAQTPQPFPKPGAPTRPQPAPPPAQPPPADVVSPRPAEAPPTPATASDPNEETLGMPVYPAAQFLTSYDAGRGQRFYLFGTNVEFAQIVGYYRTVLKSRGNLVYEQPAVHTFEVGRYRDDAVAFPPGITVKDYTWGGSEGYLHVVAGAQPVRFRTIVQVVPPPPGVVGR
jgi:hypothetical protein